MVDKEKDQEVWKTYPDYLFIEVNQFGEVRTKDRYVPSRGGKRLIKGHVLKQYHNHGDYLYVVFSVNGKNIHLLVHRIVAICFIPNPNGYPVVNHKDNDRANNSASNLEWCSYEYNEDYKKNFGTSQAEVVGRPVIAINPETSEVFWFESQSETGRQLDVYPSNIRRVFKGQCAQTGGFWFCNADENAVEKVREKFGDKIALKVEELMRKNC